MDRRGEAEHALADNSSACRQAPSRSGSTCVASSKRGAGTLGLGSDMIRFLERCAGEP
jgi:hypothetical protein